MNAVLYLRKSRADDPHEEATETLRRHEETLRALAAARDILIIGVYREVVSGDRLEGRTEMKRLLADCRHPPFDTVLCMDIDRLGRGSMAEQGLILDTFKAAGVRILTPRKEYDLSDDIDETYSEFESFIARQELKAIKRRLRRGIRHSAEQGAFVSAPPYGYRRTVTDGKPTLAPVEEEAEAVRLIFSLYTEQGCGCRQIADRLQAMGYLPRRAASFSRTAVLDILSNPVYIGRIVRTGADPVDAPGLHPPLIATEQFDAAAQLRKQRGHPPRGKRPLQNPLAGLVVCGRCGQKWQRLPASASRAYDLLGCPRRGCLGTLRLADAEEAVRRGIQPLLPEELFPHNEPPADATATRREQIICQRERLYTLVEQGVYTPQEYAARRAKLDAQINAATPPPVCPPPPVSPEAAYDKASAAGKNAFLKQLLTHIEIDRGESGWEIHLFAR